MNDKNQKGYLFWNILQKLAIVMLLACVAYLCVSVVLYCTTMPAGSVESMWGPERYLPNTLLVLGAAVLSSVLIFITAKMKNKR